MLFMATLRLSSDLFDLNNLGMARDAEVSNFLLSVNLYFEVILRARRGRFLGSRDIDVDLSSILACITVFDEV
jgi:hypothetical protein